MLSFYTLSESLSNKKAVILLGSPLSGKTTVANMFKEKGFRLALPDQYVEAKKRKELGKQGTLYVTKDNDQVWAAIANDKRISHYLKNGYPFIVEKTGQNYQTVTSLYEEVKKYGYEFFAVYVETPEEIVLGRNKTRTSRQFQDEKELLDIHDRVRDRIYPNKFGSGLSGLFGENFFIVSGDGSAESIDTIKKVVNYICER